MNMEIVIVLEVFSSMRLQGNVMLPPLLLYHNHVAFFYWICVNRMLSPPDNSNKNIKALPCVALLYCSA